MFVLYIYVCITYIHVCISQLCPLSALEAVMKKSSIQIFISNYSSPMKEPKLFGGSG